MIFSAINSPQAYRKFMVFLPVLLLSVLMFFPPLGRSQPITEGFDNFDTGTRPAGWTFNGCNNNSDTYTTAGDFGVASPLDQTG